MIISDKQELRRCVKQLVRRAEVFVAELDFDVKNVDKEIEDIRLEYGSNDHHKIEAIFKAVAHALQQAVKLRDGNILSSKGVLA